MRIDAHHHLWRYKPSEYEWIDERMSVLKRDFLPSHLDIELRAAGVDATVAVQARQTLQETRWLLECAAQSSSVTGVVGWAPLEQPDFLDTIEHLRHNNLLKGLRHVVQGELPGFLDREAFNRGITALLPTGLVYDLLIRASQLSEAIRFVDRHPRQVFVLDHIAKPDIANHGFVAWHKPFRELARRPNVVCKLSGMVTEADWRQWTPSSLKPYLDAALEAYGPSRLMCGSDWPVLNVAATYIQWWQVLREWLVPLSDTERQHIEAGTAIRTYQLTLAAKGSPST